VLVHDRCELAFCRELRRGALLRASTAPIATGNADGLLAVEPEIAEMSA
jgi:hypothetical protein